MSLGNRPTYAYPRPDASGLEKRFRSRSQNYPQIVNDFKTGNVEQAYESFVQLPFLDQMAMYMTPGLGNIIDGYEAKYFKDKEIEALEKSGRRPTEEYEVDLMMLGYNPMEGPLNKPTMPSPYKGSGESRLFGGLSGLSAASSLIGVGEVPSLIKGATLFGLRKLGKLGTDTPAKPKTKSGGEGGPPPEGPIAPVIENNIRYTAFTPRYAPPNVTKSQTNNIVLTSTVALADTPFYRKNPDKAVPINNIFQAMERYGVEGGAKGQKNNNVSRQIKSFVDEDFIANNKTVTPRALMEHIISNSPKLQEHHAYYPKGAPEAQQSFIKMANHPSLFDLSTPALRKELDPKDVLKTDRSKSIYGERTFNMYDDGRLYGGDLLKYEDGYISPRDPNNPRTTIQSGHAGLAKGTSADLTDTGGRYTHQRYTVTDVGKDKNVTIVQEIQSDPYRMIGDKQKLVTRNLDDAEGGSIKEIIPILDEQYTEGEGALNAMKLASPGGYKAMDENRTLSPFLLKYDDILARQESEVNTFITTRNQEAFDEYQINESYFETGERFADEIDEIKGRFTLEKENALREALGDDFFDAGSKYYNEAVRKLPRAEAGDWFTDNVKFGIQTAVKNDSPYVLLPKNDKALVKSAGDGTVVLSPNQLKYFEESPAHRVRYNVTVKPDGKGGFKEKDAGEMIDTMRPNRKDGDDVVSIINTTERVDKDLPGSNIYPPYDSNPEAMYYIDARNIRGGKHSRRASSYARNYDRSFKQIEQDYKLILNPTEFTDELGNEYFKIMLTPQVKEAFEVLRLNKGGHVTKPLMTLKYGI